MADKNYKKAKKKYKRCENVLLQLRIQNTNNTLIREVGLLL
jgi:hypothetical protein